MADLAFYPIDHYESYDILLEKIIARYELETLRKQGTQSLAQEDQAEWEMNYKSAMANIQKRIEEVQFANKEHEAQQIPDELQTSLNKYKQKDTNMS